MTSQTISIISIISPENLGVIFPTVLSFPIIHLASSATVFHLYTLIRNGKKNLSHPKRQKQITDSLIIKYVFLQY